MQPVPNPEPIWLTTAEAARVLRVGKSTLEKMRHFRRPGPPFIRHGARVRYPVADLRAWAASQAREASR